MSTLVDPGGSLLDVWESLTPAKREKLLASMPPEQARELTVLLEGEWDYRLDPAGWVGDVLGEFLWSRQVQVMEAVRDHPRVVVRSGHGVGKTRVASRVVTWWVATHPPAETRVVTTATTFSQVRGVLWQEIGGAARSGRLPGRVLQTEWHILDGTQDTLVGMGRKPSDYDQAAFQGIHARYVLVVIDEADGVGDDLWVQATALATGPDCRILAIGNPVDPQSHMARICQPDSGWHQMYISCLHSPVFTEEVVAADPALTALFDAEGITPSREPLPDNLHSVLVGPDYVANMLADFGADAPEFVSRVLGRYPIDSTEGLLPREFLARARASRPLASEHLHPVHLGVDVGAGGDRSVIRGRRGVQAMPQRWVSTSRDPEQVVDLTIEAILDTGATSVKVDAIGWGHGVAGSLRRRLQDLTVRGHHPVAVHPVYVSETSNDPRRFRNQRAEMWWMARELSQDGGWDLSMLDDADPVLTELVAPRYSTVGGRIQIEPKEELRRRLRRSPDDADALLLAYWNPPADGPVVHTTDRWGRASGRR